MKNLPLLAILISMFVFTACKDNNGNETTPSTTTITFDHSDPLEVDLSTTIPTIKGTITNDDGLSSYSVTILEGSTQEVLISNASLNNVTTYSFDIEVDFTINTKSLTISAIDAGGNTTTKTLTFSVTDSGDVDPTPTGKELAFPGAEGHGALTTGGRGGKVLIVNSLEDNATKSGTLRWAINQTGARTVVFQVSGDIVLSSPLKISKGDLTIAGQTAPGDGICVRGDYMQLSDGLDNVIIRYIRFRSAVGSGEYDAAWGRNCSNIILDHCSFSWGNDEVASFYNNENFTMQWCMITESFYNSTHPKGMHGYGGLWGGMNATFHHNLIAHHTSRNPRFCGGRFHWDTWEKELVDFRNNVIYNWASNSAYGGEAAKINMVNNYYKPGPATQSSKTHRIVEIYGGTNDTDYPEDGQWYIDGNYVYGNSTVTADNTQGVDFKNTIATSLSELLVSSPFDISENMTTETAEEAFVSVLASVGASLSRDAVDARIVEEAKEGTATYGGTYGAGTGIIDSQTDVGGYPTLSQYDEITDNDGDGMDDDWETANGLDPGNSADHSKYTLSDVYTNLEVYMNSLVE